LCSATKTTANITKTTENDSGGKENEEISKKETCSYMVSDLAYSARACVEQLHLFEKEEEDEGEINGMP
jgi:hypothetical protein